jgi:hypothetical protein
MAGNGDTITVNDRLDALAQGLHAWVAQVVRETADYLATTYRETAPEVSGFMASSVYTVTAAESTYGQQLQGDGPRLDPVDAPTDDTTAIAAVAATYAGDVELGTVHMAAEPAFYPAADSATQYLARRLSEADAALSPYGIKG